MTIRRQYSLPNCTLVLEGLSDGSATPGAMSDPRPLITILVNAECHFAGQEKPLSGGRDFFESLVRVVSRYAQEFLSHIPHPKLHGDKPELVQLHGIKEKNLHVLTLLGSAEALPTGAGMVRDSVSPGAMPQATPVQTYLTTVQLFDLVEAIDQFLADRRTLPDLSVPLEPLSRRYRRADQPLAKRAAPAALGTTSLALAAIALFLVPIPQVREPKPVESRQNASDTSSPSATSDSQASASPTSSPPSASELEEALASAQEISDPTELNYLQLNLRKKLNQAWKDRGEVDDDLEYQLSVGKDGAIIGYKPIDETPVAADKQTPLPELLYIPTEGGVAKQEAIAQFRVVFTDNGVLQISPWRGRTGKAGLGPEITDSSQLRDLNDKLREQLLDKWEETPTFPRELVYRIGITEDGTIANYEPINTPAWDYIPETPLDSLIKPDAAGIGGEGTGVVPQKPLAHFRVVFKPSRSLEVSPWRGYR
jgi:hypothetical protein